METDHEIHKLLLPIHAEGLVVSTMNSRLLSLCVRISGLNLSWSSLGTITKTVLVYETGCFHQFASDQISFNRPYYHIKMRNNRAEILQMSSTCAFSAGLLGQATALQSAK